MKHSKALYSTATVFELPAGESKYSGGREPGREIWERRCLRRQPVGVGAFGMHAKRLAALVVLGITQVFAADLTPERPALQPAYRAGATKPSPRNDANSKLAHEQLVAKAKAGGIDLYFLGDSITRRWGCTDPQWAANLDNWKKNFFGWNAGNFGWGADGIQNMLWRIQNGELDGVHPKVISILAGTNNVGTTPGGDEQVV